MTDSNGRDSNRTGEALSRIDFDDCSDRDLIDSYHRHSKLLIHNGFDTDIADQMGQVEVELRARGIDPDDIVHELWVD